MINLLPPEDYKELHAARHNVLLVRLLISAMVCLLGTLFAISATYVLINIQEQSAQAAKQASEQSLSQFQKVEVQTKDFQHNLLIAKQILDKSVSYRTMLINIAQVLPANAVISNLQLSPDTVDTPTTITINTTSYQAAVHIKDVLNRSSIAKDVSIGGVSAATTGTTAASSSQYPISVQMSLTFTKGLLKPVWLSPANQESAS